MPTTYQWQEFPYDLPGTSYGATSVEEPDNSPVLSVSSDEDTDLTGPMLVSVSVKLFVRIKKGQTIKHLCCVILMSAK